MKLKSFFVTIPIAGHVHFEIEAESEEQALEKAWKTPAEEGELEYERLKEFHEGNVCYCPFPWKITVESEDDIE